MSNKTLNTSRPPYRRARIAAAIGLAASALFAAPSAMARPNILYIVADDLGFSDISALGGEIATPNLDALVKSGRILPNFHVSTVCAVTRSMLYSGTDHHLVGEGTMGTPGVGDVRRGKPGYEGYLNNSSLSIAQLLKDGGYHTYIAGKWHLGSQINSATNKTPDQWGFERSFTLLGGATGNHFGHDTVAARSYSSDGQYAAPPTLDANGKPWYDTNGYTDKIISYIDSNINDGKPFAAFATFTSPHWPLQVPEPWLSKYAGKYDGGYDVIRARRLLRQKTLGIVPADYTLPNAGLPDATTASAATPNNGTANARYINADSLGDPTYADYGAGKINRKWSSLTANQKKTQARYMEVYAGMVENLDYNIGRLIQHLKDIGQYENTFIVFHSDNGAEGWPISDAQDTTNFNNFAKLGKDQTLFAGTPTNIQYGLRWAEVSATPLRLSKGFTTEGGTSAPAIVHLPGQTTQLPTLRDFIHVRDSAPTLLDVAGITPAFTPATPVQLTETQGNALIPRVTYNGNAVYPITGHSALSELLGASTGPLHPEPVGEEQYGRTYIRSGQWKATFLEPPWGPVDGHWQLYDIEADRGETNDVSAQHPEIVNQLYQQWRAYLYNTGGINPLRPQGYY